MQRAPVRPALAARTLRGLAWQTREALARPTRYGRSGSRYPPRDRSATGAGGGTEEQVGTTVS